MKNSDCSKMIDVAMIDKTPRNEAFSVAKLDYQKPTKNVDKCHWIGLRENLQETMVFTIKYRAFL